MITKKKSYLLQFPTSVMLQWSLSQTSPSQTRGSPWKLCMRLELSPLTTRQDCAAHEHWAYASILHTINTIYRLVLVCQAPVLPFEEVFQTIKLLLSNWHFLLPLRVYTSCFFAAKILLKCLQAHISCYQTENQITVLSTSWSSDECLFGTMFVWLCTSA